MKILSISAQKPNSTGSGVYLTEMVREFARQGHEQVVVAGVTRADVVELPEGVRFYPVYFTQAESESCGTLALAEAAADIPYTIVGMSDEMPYPSTRYCDMTPEMVRQFREGFLKVLEPVVKDFDPEIIVCHHLYLLTAFVREHFTEKKVCGFCHNTDVRQMQKTDLEREYIAGQIRRLDRIFLLQEAQRELVADIYGTEQECMTVVGIGYNHNIFYSVEGDSAKESTCGGVTRLIFAGKISEKKGVASLLRSLSQLPCRQEQLEICLAGSAGNEEEYEEIRTLAAQCPYKVHFPGRLSQPELAQMYHQSDIFVLPSFYEGLPLVVVEALACGCRVVMTDLPGVKEWLSQYVKGADIRFVQPPRLHDADEPEPESLPEFERRLAEALLLSIQSDERRIADVSAVSWGKIAREVVGERGLSKVRGSAEI